MDKNDKRKKALEDFLNDSVIKIGLGFYKWNSITYQVFTQNQVNKKGLKKDSFITYLYNGKTYYIREMSDYLLKQYKSFYKTSKRMDNKFDA